MPGIFFISAYRQSILSFGPGIEHPLRGGFVHPRLERRNAERHLHSLVDPSLCGRVEGFPDEMSLFGLDESPRNAQVSAAQAREIVERIGRGGPYNVPDRATFYKGGDRGYTDYPTLKA